MCQLAAPNGKWRNRFAKARPRFDGAARYDSQGPAIAHARATGHRHDTACPRQLIGPDARSGRSGIAQRRDTIGWQRSTAIGMTDAGAQVTELGSMRDRCGTSRDRFGIGRLRLPTSDVDPCLPLPEARYPQTATGTALSLRLHCSRGRLRPSQGLDGARRPVNGTHLCWRLARPLGMRETARTQRAV